MTKFIKVRTVAYASVTGSEIQNAYIHNKFAKYIVNCDSVETIGPLEGYLTNNVYQYFRIILKSGTVLFCHFEDYQKFDELCEHQALPVKDVPKETIQMICDTPDEALVVVKPVARKTVKTSKKTVKTTKKSSK